MSLRLFFFDKVRLCNTLELIFDEIREQVATGLSNRELAAHALAMEFSSVEKLLHGHLRFDRTLQNFDGVRNKETKDVASGKTKFRSDSSKGDNVADAKGSSSSSTSRKSELKCYNYAKTGHFSNKCPEPRKNKECSRCGELGHHVKDCPKPIPMERAQVNIVASTRGCVGSDTEFQSVGRIENSSADRLAKYFKKVKINGIPMQSMIDPGSSDCTIKATAVLYHDLEVIRLPSVLGGFGKPDTQYLVTSCGVVRFTVKVDAVEAEDVVLRIVPDDVQSTDVLIGRTFTELEQVAYFKVDNKLVFL